MLYNVIDTRRQRTLMDQIMNACSKVYILIRCFGNMLIWYSVHTGLQPTTHAVLTTIYTGFTFSASNMTLEGKGASLPFVSAPTPVLHRKSVPYELICKKFVRVNVCNLPAPDRFREIVKRSYFLTLLICQLWWLSVSHPTVDSQNHSPLHSCLLCWSPDSLPVMVYFAKCLLWA